MLYFRCDMNENIATGHVMRCLSIAAAAKNMGIDSLFILADENAVQLIEERGFDSHVLYTRWDNLEGELSKLKLFLKNSDATCLFVDSYYATQSYYKELSEIVKVACFDDFGDKALPVSMVINYDAIQKAEEYRSIYSCSNTKVCYGPEFAPLRSEFCSQKERIFDGLKSILVMSGGSDSAHAVKKILSAIKDFEVEKIVAIAGRYNNDYEHLVNEYGGNPIVEIKKSVSNIMDYMLEADVCISAGGNTIYELAACGTPVIVYSINESQVPASKHFEEVGLALYAGDINKDKTLENIVNSLSKIEGKLSCISNRMQSLVDGRGCERIVEAIEGMI